jgi:hypothetical protein
MQAFPREKKAFSKYAGFAMAAWLIVTAFLLSLPNQGYADGSSYVDLRKKMTPAKIQGQRGTCNVFGATAIMEFLLKEKLHREIDLSESYNYWAAKKYTLNSQSLKDKYSNRDGLAGFLAVEAYRYGSMLEADWPYEMKNWKQLGDSRCKYVNGNPITECFTGTPPKNAKRLKYAMKPDYIDRREIAQFILRHKKPVLMNMLWCEGAINHKTGVLRMPTAREVKAAIQKQSGHVITLVGYFPDSRQFIFKNCYGPSWGKNGYGIIPERYVIDYCEVCPKLKNINRFSKENRQFLIKAAMGVSGILIWKANQ